MISLGNLFYYLFLALLGYLVLYPLFQIVLLKIKYGNQVRVYFFPIIGLFAKMLYGQTFHKDILEYKKQMIKAYPDMKVFITTIYGTKLWYQVVDPDLLKQGLQYIENYEKFGAFPYIDTTFLKGILFTEGAKWKNQRKLIAHQFTYEKLKDRSPIIKNITEQIFSKEIESGKAPHILKVSAKVTGSVIIETFFGQNFLETPVFGKNVVDQFIYFIIEWSLMSLFDSWVLLRTNWLGYKSYDQIPKWMLTKKDKELYPILLELRKNIEAAIKDRIDNRDYYLKNKQDDFLQVYVEELSKKIYDYLFVVKNPDQITLEEVIHQFITFFFAGMDTTSHLVSAAVYVLGKYPGIQDELRNSLKKISPDYQNLNINELNQLKILSNFINETLRFYTPVDELLPRDVVKDHKLGFLQLRKGDTVEFSVLHSQFNEKYFKNPDKFDIHRWDDEKLLKESFAFIPFSAGPRNCIGQHMAQIEAKLMLSYLIYNYKMELDQSKKLVMTFVTMYEPEDDTYVKFTKI